MAPRVAPREFYPFIGIIALIVQSFLERTRLGQVRSVDVAGSTSDSVEAKPPIELGRIVEVYCASHFGPVNQRRRNSWLDSGRRAEHHLQDLRERALGRGRKGWRVPRRTRRRP